MGEVSCGVLVNSSLQSGCFFRVAGVSTFDSTQSGESFWSRLGVSAVVSIRVRESLWPVRQSWRVCLVAT